MTVSFHVWCAAARSFLFFEKLPVDRKTQSESESSLMGRAKSTSTRFIVPKRQKKSFNFSSPFIARRLSVFSYWIVCDEAQQESDNHDKTILCFLHSLVLNTISLNHFMEEVDEVCEFVSLCILCFCFAFFFILIAASLCLSIQACWIPQQSPSLWCCSRRFNAKVRAGPATITNSPAIWNGRVFTIGRIASMFVHVLSSSLLFFFCCYSARTVLEKFPIWRRHNDVVDDDEEGDGIGNDIDERLNEKSESRHTQKTHRAAKRDEWSTNK